MLKLHRPYLLLAALGLALMPLPYALNGALKAAHLWKWLDIFCEGGTAAMAGIWFLITLSSRPGGLVTRLLALGLAAIMLGSWADCLDEVYSVSKDALWDNWLEALMPLGMLTLTVGMYHWRQEQFSLNEHLQKRERLFRDHRAFDRLTQLAGAGYLRSQIRLEHERNPSQPCALVLLDIDGFHRINRAHGQKEGDRVLQAVGHMLLLNLRNQDLLCRYAGDRYALLLPGTDAAEADELAAHLCAMVAGMRHAGRQGRVPVSLRHACTLADGDPEALLAKLSGTVDRAARASAPDGLPSRATA
ncbi:GGDEF domain-containing protein [Pseudoduganella namucuonensis]|uniref:diguanylate cyclase n=1 Tax=Pseudoduganella namucuonensis TaxID=1035707 RepID=A0A1I7M296_9BURK|nr:GGDEF domain-containing protein [Pseudoduganella namucuonensis]SFV16039.1 diguanylate cyclase (GGDEF) domain-containing protein [Pseudoduganella namucuonensis]